MVNLDTKDVQLAASMDVGNLVRVIAILILIILGAYFLTKYIGRRSLRQGMRDPRRSRSGASSPSKGKPEFGHMVAVVDRIAVDRDKTLMVVEFKGHHYLIGTTQDGFQCIDQVEMTPAEQEEQEAEAAAVQETSEPEAWRPDDEKTFGQRFRKAFGIVLRSYLPKGMRGDAPRAGSFDEQLKARIHERSESPGGSASNTDRTD